MREIDRIISEVEDMHPYKEKGCAESYSSYNEGWSDACDILGERLKLFFAKFAEKVQTVQVRREFIEKELEVMGDHLPSFLLHDIVDEILKHPELFTIDHGRREYPPMGMPNDYYRIPVTLKLHVLNPNIKST